MHNILHTWQHDPLSTLLVELSSNLLQGTFLKTIQILLATLITFQQDTTLEWKCQGHKETEDTL